MDGKILVMKLREAGLSQGFFTRKRNIDSAKELTRTLNSTWKRSKVVTGDKGQESVEITTESFTAEEKKAATQIWG